MVGSLLEAWKGCRMSAKAVGREISQEKYVILKATE